MRTEITNTQECFVQLWRKLERTRQLLGMQYKRFCIRRILQSWLGPEATDDFIWEVCNLTVVDDEQVCGIDILPPPALSPRKSREFLVAFVEVKLGIGLHKVNVKALDAAYSIVCPNSTPLNIRKKSSKRKTK